ncbi:hypothetical protein FisN_20Lh185 [Fistulifera solaris]|uniref:Sulfotransferase domain-containing protein n=1 Tax=Fistulifera solaris TaxID=1519565 RepID=A0A1Z5KS08_FISSO|nr:hypothetical protein FisN_20Lh185 [Fistulifera solaris]|eukprot:GAX28882.1 hypothetical protein FisN_20Lh185 [Fistulifera solaris]
MVIGLVTLSSASMMMLSRMHLSRQMQSQYSIPNHPNSLHGLRENSVFFRDANSQESFVAVMSPSERSLKPPIQQQISQRISVRESIVNFEKNVYLKRRTLRNNHTRKRATSLPTFPAPIKVPFPIFVASLFKSGTTTINAYFQCGGQRSVHWETDDGERTGKCLYENVRDGKDPFAGCGDYDVWTDNSFIRAPSLCWDPSVTSLDAIYQAYPNATILLTVRDSLAWTRSVIRWGKLFQRLRTCLNLWPNQPQKSPLDVEDLRNFYWWQIQHVRDFAAAHPSMTFLEVGLEDSATASILEEKIGIPASCWGKHNENDKQRLTKEKLEALVKLPQPIEQLNS